MDRRVQRTRDVLHQALISLMIEKGYEVITVQDIIDRANVGRSTFYAHYVGKQDLLLSGLKNLSKHLAAHQRAAVTRKREVFRRRVLDSASPCLSTLILTEIFITLS